MLYSRLYKKQSTIQEPFILAFPAGKMFHKCGFIDHIPSWTELSLALYYLDEINVE